MVQQKANETAQDKLPITTQARLKARKQREIAAFNQKFEAESAQFAKDQKAIGLSSNSNETKAFQQRQHDEIDPFKIKLLQEQQAFARQYGASKPKPEAPTDYQGFVTYQ
jgi:PBP1b-binding outer membrane lipoprotein LpoB